MYYYNVPANVKGDDRISTESCKACIEIKTATFPMIKDNALTFKFRSLDSESRVLNFTAWNLKLQLQPEPETQ